MKSGAKKDDEHIGTAFDSNTAASSHNFLDESADRSSLKTPFHLKIISGEGQAQRYLGSTNYSPDGSFRKPNLACQNITNQNIMKRAGLAATINKKN